MQFLSPKHGESAASAVREVEKLIVYGYCKDVYGFFYPANRSCRRGGTLSELRRGEGILPVSFV